MGNQTSSNLKHIEDVPSTFGLKHIFDVFCLLCLKNVSEHTIPSILQDLEALKADNAKLQTLNDECHQQIESLRQMRKEQMEKLEKASAERKQCYDIIHNAKP